MYNEDIDGVTIDPLGQDVRAGVGNVWSARLVLMRVRKAERDRQGFDADRCPPGGLVAVAMEFAVMKAANWDGVFVANLVAERPGLGECDAPRSASGRRRRRAAW
jgi:hypothetical protein